MNKKLTVYFSAIISICLLGIVSIFSCTSKCGTTTCQNSGTCSNNICVCPTGYSGGSCQTAWSDKFIGTYKCSRSNCVPAVSGGGTTWQSAITKATTNGGYTIYISNFDNSNTSQEATVDSAGNLTIKPASGTYGVSASATYSVGLFNITFTTYVTGGAGYHCVMTLIKE